MSILLSNQIYLANIDKQQIVVLDTKWLSKEIIVHVLAKRDGQYGAEVKCLPKQVYYTRHQLAKFFMNFPGGQQAIGLLEHLKLIFCLPKAEGITVTGRNDKFMIPARQDEERASGWTEDSGSFAEYYGRCVRCKGVTDMIVPSVFPYLQHQILDKICKGKKERFRISNRWLRFVTADGIQGIVQLTKDKKAIILAVRGE